MNFINFFILALVSIFLLWSLYRTIKYRPELFSANNLNKSFFSMGILAIILIAVIGLAVIALSK